MDIGRALNTISILGYGCFIFKNDYVCTIPFSLSDDSAELMGICEEVQFLFNFL